MKAFGRLKIEQGYHNNRSILLHATYLFLLVTRRLTCNLLFKTFKSFKLKISSTSLVYAQYMFRPTLVIFR
jgi:hypothetical protein